MFSFSINKKIDSALKKNKRELIFHRFDDMKSVLVLFNFKDWTEIKCIIQDLESTGKKVILWTIQPRRHEDNQIIFPEKVRVVCQKEISRLWGISPSLIKEFRSLQCDTLIDLTEGSNKILLYLLASSPVNFRIGIYEPEYNLYDFIVIRPEEASLAEAYNQVKFYLNNVQSGVNYF